MTTDEHRISEHPKGQGIGVPSSVKLDYTSPYDFDQLLSFFRTRQLDGVEKIDGSSYTRTVAWPQGAVGEQDEGRQDDQDDQGKGVLRGWIKVSDIPSENVLELTMSDSLSPVASKMALRVRHQFDTDCDPGPIHTHLASLEETVPGAANPGVRLPGCFDPFETCSRAILGQQISVSAANKLAARITEAFGACIHTGVEGLTHAFPSAEDICALDNIEDALGRLGVIKSRSRCIECIAHMIVNEELVLDPSGMSPADMDRQRNKLLEVKGIGPWTANYIAMRVFGHPDVFLETDAGIKHALPEFSPKERLELAEKWRPWRSYANISLWNSLS